MMNPSHREAIAATLPRKVPEEFWTELEQVFDVFRLVEGRRRSRPPTKRHKRWLRIAALAKKEGDDVLLEYAEARAVAYGMMGATFRGRNNFYRSHFLIGSVLDLWLRYIADDLRVSRSSGTTRIPGGPLIRYVTACVVPVLGKKVSPETIRNRIIREKRSLAGHKKRLAAGYAYR